LRRPARGATRTELRDKIKDRVHERGDPLIPDWPSDSKEWVVYVNLPGRGPAIGALAREDPTDFPHRKA